MAASARLLLPLSLLLTSSQPARADYTSGNSLELNWKSPFCEMATGNVSDLRMSLWSVPGSDGLEIYLSGVRAPRTTNTSDVELRLPPHDEGFFAHASWDGFSWRGVLHLTVVKARDFLSKFGSSDRFEVQDSGKLVAIAYKGAGPAIEGFQRCLEAHQREWGVEPATLSALKARPEVIPDTWMTSSDYPGDALDKRQDGIIVMRLTTDETGKVVGCTIVDSIATKSMEDSTCRLALKQARFKAALDAHGLPTRATFITSVRFHIWQ